MVPLNYYFHAFLDLCQHGVWIASKLGFGNVERSHVYDDTSLEGMVGLTELESVTSCASRYELHKWYLFLLPYFTAENRVRLGASAPGGLT
jgi:hypothetical protein